jgi:hypothetical protein
LIVLPVGVVVNHGEVLSGRCRCRSMSSAPVVSQHSSMRRPGPRMCTMKVHSLVVPSASFMTTFTV